MNALEVRNLTKYFGKMAVNNLNLTVKRGEFYSLLGPNGAGKSTSLRIVAGILPPTSGQITILGIDAIKNPIAAKKITSWLPDEPTLYDKLSPLEYLEFIAGLWDMEPGIAETRAIELLKQLGMYAMRNYPCDTLSRGQKQKVALAGALIHDPRLIMLDEPLTGLDVGSAQLTKEILNERLANNDAVILTTHILDVAEKLSDRIGVIVDGRLIVEGTIDELREKFGLSSSYSLEDIFVKVMQFNESGQFAAERAYS